MSGKEDNCSSSGSGSKGYETSRSNVSGGSVPNMPGTNAPNQQPQLRDPNQINVDNVEMQPLELGEIGDGQNLISLCTSQY